MKTPHLLAALTCSFATTASAFCVDDNGSFGNGTHLRLWHVADSSTNWISTIDSPTLSTTTTSDLYWREAIEAAVDTASQDWSRIARARLKVGFDRFSSTVTRTDDAISGIVPQDCPDPNGFVAGIDMSFADETCDIYIRNGSCSTFAMAVGIAGSDGFATNFERTLAHEMGHCLGLDHPSAPGDCTTSKCGDFLGCDEGQLMCQNACGKLTDLPHADDIDGQQFAMDPAALALPRRYYEIQTGYYTTGDVYTNDRLISPTLSAVYPPRIDCRHRAGSPDCVLGRVYADGNVRFDRLEFNGVGPTAVTAQTSTVSINTRRPVDVSISHTENVAVMAVAESNSDNELVGVRILRFDTASTTTLSSVVLDPSTDADLTMGEPRVTFVRGIFGSPCTSDFNCVPNTCNTLDGMCNTPTAGRFLVGTIAPNRRLRLWLSNDAAGNGPYVEQGWVNTSGGAATFDPINENFDIHCPRHVLPNSAGDRICRILFTPASQSTLDGTIRSCTVTVQTTGTVRIDGCAEGFAPQRAPSIGALADYGTGTPGTQRTTRGWLATISRRVPDVNLTNSNQALWAHAGTTFAAGDLVEHINYNVDSNTCTTFSGDDEPRSYFGGTAFDYCEDCDRTIRIHLGSWSLPSTSNKCY